MKNDRVAGLGRAGGGSVPAALVEGRGAGGWPSWSQHRHMRKGEGWLCRCRHVALAELRQLRKDQPSPSPRVWEGFVGLPMEVITLTSAQVPCLHDVGR